MKIITKDNSITFYNKKYKETYHSISGAEQEAIEKFIKPTLEKTNPNILDICFGLGYNSATALDYFKNCNIIALENDKNILKKIKNINSNFKNYNIIKQVSKDLKHKNIKIIIGDAKETIKNLKDNYFDIILFDPFSIKKQPEMWEYNFLKNINKKMKKTAILTTYSCSKEFRNNLKKLNFIVKDRPKIGRNSPSTIAIKK